MQKTLYKRAIILLLLSLLVFSRCTCRKEREEDKGLGFILSVKNTVFYKNFRSLVWVSASENLPLYAGDYIRTGDKSSATVMIEKSELIVDENTLIKIEKKGITRENSQPIEIVILFGDISHKDSPQGYSRVEFKRLRDGKIVKEDLINKNKPEWEEDSDNIADIRDIFKVQPVSPCLNEKMNKGNILFRWDKKSSGILRVYRNKSDLISVRLYDEDSKSLELESGSYEWEITDSGNNISQKCSFVIAPEVISEVNISGKSRKIKYVSPVLSPKRENIIESAQKEGEAKQDVVKMRLENIQKVIDNNIDQIKNTRKSINPEKIKNYAQIYAKLDELISLLNELRVVQSALLMEVIKLNDPRVIVKYIDELEDIEKNLKGIEAEVRNVENIIVSDGIKSEK
ncbi:MAG: hypothetical protein N3B13_04270 [Deltaproteobacteria bacterium]|nr:hypothetical protein [Deltaproteobacteria bacterium]